MNSGNFTTRRFLDYGWAWPGGDLDLLLKAVLLRDQQTALKLGLSWLKAHDINNVEFRERRLLTALIERFGKQLSPSPAYPRLVGLQRLLWTRSHMVFRDSREALEALAAAGISFMFIKGASRIALDPAAQRGRVSPDIDILLRHAEMQPAFEILLERGWQAATGDSEKRLKSTAPNYRAMNFQKGEFGDVDVHQVAYHMGYINAEDDAALWQRSLPVIFNDISARVPAAEDRIALAIAHGAHEGHDHSDWLVDIDSIISGNRINWDSLLLTFQKRNLLVPAASALSYLSQEIGTPIPPEALKPILLAADQRGLAGRMSLLECKPKTDLNWLAAGGRVLARSIRRKKSGRTSKLPAPCIWNARTVRRIKSARRPLSHLATIEVGAGARGILEITVQVDLPYASRRIEMELSAGPRHLALLRYRKWRSYSGFRELKFRGEINLANDENAISIEARPSRFIRHWDNPADVELYGPLPFFVSKHSFRSTIRN